jgi:outer membrane protein OmpA-like peptidoglycan-associated protein
MKTTLLILFVILSVACSNVHVANTSQHLKSDTEVKFRFNSDNILNKYTQKLDKDIAFLKRYPDKAVTIEGHTCLLGENEYNLDLGDRRAKMIKAYFIKNGIDAERIITVTYGEEKPKEHYKSTRENRRIIIMDMNK